MKIALIQPPSWGIKNPPFSSAILSAYLKQHGHDVYKRDLNIELYQLCKGNAFGSRWKLNESFWGIPAQVELLFQACRQDIDRIVGEIIDSGAQLIGFSTVWSSIQPAILLAREIKKRAPQLVVVFGGPQCSITSEGGNILTSPWVDYAVSGEGEVTLLELVQALQGEREIGSVTGIFYRSGGQFVYSGDRELLRDLDALPFPDYDDYDLSLYEEPVMLPVYSSRGCPNRCIYCDEKILWKGFRHRSGARIFAEVQWLVGRYGIKRFEFCDSLVNGHLETLDEFCDLVIAADCGIEWMGQATVRPGMTKEMIAKIKQSGCFHLCFGMEHFSKPLLKQMGKMICQDTDFDGLVSACHEAELGTGLNWMFGYLGETEADFQEDLDFFSRNAPLMKRFSVNPSPGFCGFTKGCEVFRDPEKYGVALHADSRFWESLDGSNSYPVRLDKYQRFCHHLQDLGVTITFPPFADPERLKGEYFADVKGDHREAVSWFRRSLERDFSVETFSRLAVSAERSGNLWQLPTVYRELVAAGLNGQGRYQAEKIIRQHFPFLNTATIKQLDSGCDLAMVQAPAWGINTPPMATALLTATMRQKGYRVLAQDLNITLYHLRGEAFANAWNLAESLVFWNSREEVLRFAAANHTYLQRWVDYLLGTGVKAVGFTIYGSSYHMSLYLAELIKTRDTAVTVIFGGPFVSRFMVGADAAAHPAVDIVVDGEGEQALEEICARLQRGESLAGCAGTFQKVADGTVVFQGERELLRDLDSIPFADFSDYSLPLYAKSFTLPAMSSRGCPNSCIFCNERPFWLNFRSRSAASIFAEMRHQLALYPHITFFEFHDSLINGNIKVLGELCDLIIASGIKVQWAGQAAIRKEMTFDLLSKLARAGCISLGYGLETASTGLMAQIGKNLARGVDPNQILADGFRAGVQCSVNFMFGLPGETEDDFLKTLRFLRENHRFIGTVNPSPSFCGFSPGTKGYNDPAKYGITFRDGFPNAHLFWEADNGTNNFLVRLQRFERFCELVGTLGVETTYPHARLLNRDEFLKDYFLAIGEQANALPHLINLLYEKGETPDLRAELLRCWPYAPAELAGINLAASAEPLTTAIASGIKNRISSTSAEKAAAVLERALAVIPREVELYLMLTELHLQQVQISHAENTLQRMLQVRPDFTEGREFLQQVRNLPTCAAADNASAV